MANQDEIGFEPILYQMAHPRVAFREAMRRVRDCFRTGYDTTPMSRAYPDFFEWIRKVNEDHPIRVQFEVMLDELFRGRGCMSFMSFISGTFIGALLTLLCLAIIGAIRWAV